MSDSLCLYSSYTSLENNNKFSLHNTSFLKTSISVLFVGATILSSLPNEHIVLNNSDFSGCEFALSSPIFTSCIETLDLQKLINLNKISQMATFEEDWNGNGARAFTKKAVELFTKVIEKLEHQPQIAPTGRNSLYVQYKMDNDDFLSFEICESTVEKVFIPVGDYDRAEVETFDGDIVNYVYEQTELFYG